MTSTEHADTPRREWMAPGLARCPTCRGGVVVSANGTLPDHYRYADDVDPHQPHVRIRCAGERVTSGDPVAVGADDELLDDLGAGRVRDGHQLTTELAEWRAAVDAEPIPDPPAVPVATHDDRCEAEYIGPAGSLTDCGCAERAEYPLITLPGNTEDAVGVPDLARVVAARLTGNELLPGLWVILQADAIGDAIELQVVTWGSSLGPSPRTESRYVLRLAQENPPTP